MGIEAFASLVRPSRAGSAPSWRQLPLAARCYIALVVAAGSLAVVGAAASVPSSAAPLVTALAMLSFLAAFARITVAVPGSVSSVSFCYVIDFTALLLLGPAAATCTAACGVWSQSTFGAGNGHVRYRTWFSIAALAVTIQTAGFVLAWLANGAAAPASSRWLTSLPLAAAVYFLANSLLIAAAVALSTRQRAFTVWRRSFLMLWRGHLYGFAFAVVAAVALMRSTLWLLPLTLVILRLTYESLHAYVAGLSESLVDPMTGAPNLRFLRNYVAQEIDRAGRAQTPLAVLMIDVNDFKSINDTHGHRAGDIALRHLAQQLQHSIRSYDLCARYAGDEFVVVLPGCQAEEVRSKAQSLQQAIAGARVDCGKGVSLPLRISVGSAVFPADGTSMDELLQVADRAMFDDKQQARAGAAAGRRATLQPEGLAAPAN